MTYTRHTRRFIFPQPGYPIIRVGGFQLCRQSACQICAVSPEASIVHYECLAIFVHESDLSQDSALGHLWAVELFRNPWLKAPLLHLEDRHLIDPGALDRVARWSKLPQLQFLPPELLNTVRHLLPHTLFWRAVSTVSAAGRVDPNQTSHPQRVLRLDSLERYERGMKIAFVSKYPRPVIRVRIDSEGIHTIQRFPAQPVYRPDRSKYWAYIMGYAADFSDVLVLFKVRTL